MSPPEIWGPAVWTLFHTLAERVSEVAYPYIAKQLFTQIVTICKFLPCPDCSADSGVFWSKINISDYKTKREFINLIYLFHNYVNAKKRKPLFNYANINMYVNYPLIPIVNNFIAKYNTKGNMKLLTESFQRIFVIKNFKKWITANIRAFAPPRQVQMPAILQVPDEEEVLEQVSESVIEEPVLESVLEPTEELVLESVLEPTEEPVLESTEELVLEPVLESTEEPVLEPTEEPVLESVLEPIAEIGEQVLAEDLALNSPVKNNKNNKKSKK